MSNSWPTLEGRLKHPITSRGEGLEQMERNGDILTPWAKKELEKFRCQQAHDAEKRHDVDINRGRGE